MQFEFEGRNYAIRWQYDSTQNPPFTLDDEGERIPNQPPFHRNKTTCIIEERGEEVKVVSVATVSRKWDEEEDKDYARKESLRKALDLRGSLDSPTLDMDQLMELSEKDRFNYLNPHRFSREFRTAAWNTYHNRKPVVFNYTEKYIKHVLTAADMRENPDLTKEFKVGETILIPIPEPDDIDFELEEENDLTD